MENADGYVSDQVPEVPNFEYDNREYDRSLGSKSLEAMDFGKDSDTHPEEVIEDRGTVHELTASDVESINPKILNNPDSFATYLIYGTTNAETISEYEEKNKNRTRIFSPFYYTGWGTDKVSANIDVFFDAYPDTDINQFMEALPEGFIVEHISDFAKHGADVAQVFSDLSPDTLKKILKEAHGSKFQEFRKLDDEKSPKLGPNRPGIVPRK